MVQHLILDKVSKSIDGRLVLNDISFSVPGRKTLAVIGPSGSGKSTLLRAINRLTDIDSGRIFLDGTSIRALDPIMLRRRVGLVPQVPAMFDAKVLQNLRYAMDLNNSYSKKALLSALHDAELDTSFLYRHASKLSVGEQQRVAIARTLTLKPEILLLDEPTSALDESITRRFEATISRLKKARGLTIVWITHDINQAKRVGDMIALIEEGQVTQLGSAETVFTRSTKHRSKNRSKKNVKGGVE